MTLLGSVVDAVDLSTWDVGARLGLGLVLGGVIGTEREFDGHDAGIRTHALLALGAAMFGVLSTGAFGKFVGSPSSSNVQYDPTRIASYVVAGVGFLAGGTILKQRDRIKGLTTAASLWVSASVGLASGLGFLVGAGLATIAAIVVLVLEGPLRRLGVRRNARSRRVSVSVAVADEGARTAVLDIVRMLLPSPHALTVTRQGSGSRIVVGRLHPRVAHELTAALLQRTDVVEVDVSTDRWDATETPDDS